MVNRSGSFSPSPAIQRVAGALRIIGWGSFWAQVVLGVISAIVLLVAGSSLGSSRPNPANPASAAATNPGTGTGLFLAFLGIVALGGSIYWAFRYTRLARKLKSANAADRPKRGDAIQTLQIGVLINLGGLLVAVLGAQAISGSLLLKSFAQGFTIFAGNALNFITPLDLLVVQANTNTILAHLIGLGSTLLILRSINRT
ncbi:MAG TPA: DUF3611 family protein [Trichocoleus sp.]|jgi:hypothetical protein